MENSRIYVDVTSSDGFAYFTIKNVSANPLNIHADELTERFVRGDVARTTEGSGLGLSIAKDLTQLQGGTFKLYIDGRSPSRHRWDSHSVTLKNRNI